MEIIGNILIVGLALGFVYLAWYMKDLLRLNESYRQIINTLRSEKRGDCK